MSYPAKCKNAYPGYTLKGYKEKKAELDRVKKSAAVWANKAQEFHISPEVYALFRKCYNNVPLVTDASILINLISSRRNTRAV